MFPRCSFTVVCRWAGPGDVKGFSPACLGHFGDLPGACLPGLSCCLLPTSEMSPPGPRVHLLLLCPPLTPGQEGARQALPLGGLGRLRFLPTSGHIVCVDKGEWISGFEVRSSPAHPSGPAVTLFLFLPFSFPRWAVEGKSQL